MIAPWEPATQVGGGGTEYGNCPGGLQPSNCLRRMISRYTSADSAHLPPHLVAAREARYLQNFFSFPWREEEQETLEDDDLEVDGWSDDPDDDPVGFLG